MKTITIVSILFLSFAFTNITLGDKPIATYRVGAAMVTVWENERQDGGTWKNFKIEKLYKRDGKWETADTFDESELLQLRAAIDAAISEQSVKKE